MSCGSYYTIVMTLHNLFSNVLCISHTAIVFTYTLFILIRFLSLSVGFQVFAHTPGSSCVHFQSKGPWGPRPFAAFPPVPSRSPSGLQLRPLQGHIPALRDTLHRLRETGRPIWPAVPVQPRGAQQFRYNKRSWGVRETAWVAVII